MVLSSRCASRMSLYGLVTSWLRRKWPYAPPPARHGRAGSDRGRNTIASRAKPHYRRASARDARTTLQRAGPVRAHDRSPCGTCSRARRKWRGRRCDVAARRDHKCRDVSAVVGGACSHSLAQQTRVSRPRGCNPRGRSQQRSGHPALFAGGRISGRSETINPSPSLPTVKKQGERYASSNLDRTRSPPLASNARRRHSRDRRQEIAGARISYKTVWAQIA